MAQLQGIRVNNAGLDHDLHPETIEQDIAWKEIKNAPEPQPRKIVGEEDPNSVNSRLDALHNSDIAFAMEQQKVKDDIAQQAIWLTNEITAIDTRLDLLEGKGSGGNGYVFKSEEFLWALGVGVSGFLLTALTETQTVTEWGPWLVGLGTGLLRFVIGFAMDWQRRQKQAEV